MWSSKWLDPSRVIQIAIRRYQSSGCPVNMRRLFRRCWPRRDSVAYWHVFPRVLHCLVQNQYSQYGFIWVEKKYIYLHVLSSPSSETGPPHAILRSLQKKQAICCFFWGSFFCGARFTLVGNGCLCFSRSGEFFGIPGDAERELLCRGSVGRNVIAILSLSRSFKNATFADSSEYEERWWGGTVSCWGEQERDMGR